MKDLINLPIFRAKHKDNNSYIIGHLIGVDKDNNLCSIRELNSNYIGGDLCIYDTLSIHFPDMLATSSDRTLENGDEDLRIFASLSSDNKFGDSIQFSFGIPNIVVTAPVVFKDGQVMVLTPKVHPNVCTLYIKCIKSLCARI